MLLNNETVRRTGIIGKNTKLVFRSNCAKSTILVEIAVETFQLNEQKELHLEKMIQFLLVFFKRNNAFNNKHRVVILLYARLLYPQFRSLEEAYRHLVRTI